MKKSNISILIFLLLSLCVQAQKSDVFQLLEQNSTKPVSYATIISKLANNSTYSNSEGIFEIKKYLNDTLKISCIGYKLIEILAASLIDSQKIFLETDTQVLESVTISLNTPEELGFFDVKFDKKSIFQ